MASRFTQDQDNISVIPVWRTFWRKFFDFQVPEKLRPKQMRSGQTLSLFLWLTDKVKGLTRTTASIYEAQQISIQPSETTGGNISCVSEGQGEKWQLTVYNGSTLVSYWFRPQFSCALDTLRSSVALFRSPPGCGMRGHRRWTSNWNVWRVIQGTPLEMSVFFFFLFFFFENGDNSPLCLPPHL